MSTIQIGVDLAKSALGVAVSEAPGVVTTRRRLSRAAFRRFLAAPAPAEALLDAYRNHALTAVPVKSVEQQAVLALRRIHRVTSDTEPPGPVPPPRSDMLGLLAHVA